MIIHASNETRDSANPGVGEMYAATFTWWFEGRVERGGERFDASGGVGIPVIQCL